MLNAISPIDGRYASKTVELADYFSEYALIRYRVRVEIAYLLKLSGTVPHMPTLDADQRSTVAQIEKEFSQEDAQQIKDIERVTNHDVKAVEYFIKGKLAGQGLETLTEWVHFGLTSQDVNNTATPLMLKDAITRVILPAIKALIDLLSGFATEWKSVPLLAHTHGQPASPTTVGKEIQVFVHRLQTISDQLETAEHFGKFGGATGNFNAHFSAFPNVDWSGFSDQLLASMGLHRLPLTTQIDHYDRMAQLLHATVRLCNVSIDLCRDIWTYISMEYFKQKTVKGEIGSSTMPHKVNPIDFENAEGNLGIAVAVFDHLANKLPISRLQRDLTDSTVLRNLGVPYAHVLIAIKSMTKGLNKLKLNEDKISADLERNWLVVAEAIQTILRREGVANPYELLKDLTRGTQKVDRAAMNQFIDGLDVHKDVKRELKAITPFNYIGNADLF